MTKLIMKTMDKKYKLINPKLINSLKNKNHSLKNNPIIPDSISQVSFEEELFIKRFNSVYNKCKSVLNKSEVTISDLNSVLPKLLPDIVSIEREKKESLEKLALYIVMKEFDITEGEIDIVCELTNKENISTNEIRKEPDSKANIQFNSMDDVKEAANEIHKRRFINSLIQGSAKKLHHIFNLYDDEINKIDYRLLSSYQKLMALSDLSFFTFDESVSSYPGGIVKVEVPKDDTSKIKIHAKALTFPVLIHELIKGVMEVIALRGLPQKTELAKFVLGKSDYMSAEFWDMRLGVGLWENFIEHIEAEDFHLKHHIFCDLVELPVNEFIEKMSEIIGGTAKGKKIINDIVYNIKQDIKRDDVEESLYNLEQEDDDDIDLNNFDFTKYL